MADRHLSPFGSPTKHIHQLSAVETEDRGGETGHNGVVPTTYGGGVTAAGARMIDNCSQLRPQMKEMLDLLFQLMPTMRTDLVLVAL